MFDLTPPSRDSELHRYSGYSNTWPWNLNKFESLSISNFILQSPVTSEMEPEPPVSPTATLSPTSSEHSLTPTTSPRTPHFKTVWGSKTLAIHSPVSQFSTAGLQSPVAHRRSTLQLILASPDYQSFSRGGARRHRRTTHTTRIDSLVNNTGMPPLGSGQLTPMETDRDGDVVMASPPNNLPRSAIWEDTTSSPILGTLVGVPLQRLPEQTCPIEDANTEQSPQQLLSGDADYLFPELSYSWPRSRSSNTSRLHRFESRSQPGQDVDSHKNSRASSTSRLNEPSLDSVTTTKIPSQLIIPNPNRAHLETSIHHLGIPLVPLVSVSTGLAHPQFPHSILQYHLLTHEQLDSLARWYHQTVDNTRERYMYPAVIERPWMWSEERDVNFKVDVALTAKRRRFGRFIGLRGCDSPIVAEREDVEIEEHEETLTERMEREWKEALRKAEEEEMLQEKIWRGRW